MKKQLFSLLVSCVFSTTLSAQTPATTGAFATDSANLETTVDTIALQELVKEIKAKSPKQFKKDFSYSYGYLLMDGLKTLGLSRLELNPKALVKGAKAGLNYTKEKLIEVDTLISNRVATKKPILSEKNAFTMAYNVGYNALAVLARDLDLKESEIDFKYFKKGYEANLKEKKSKFSSEEMKETVRIFFQPKQIAKQKELIEKRNALAAQNLAKGKAFLKENAKKEGVVVTASGLQYKIIKEGAGNKPAANASVKVHYTGTFIDGKVFDSSIERGKPASFSLAKVIKGWQEGIPLMNVGSRYVLYVPTELAYGSTPPNGIPQNAVLVFDVELLEVLKRNEDDVIKMSYAYGYSAGKAIAQAALDSAETDVQQFITGFKMGFTKKEDAYAMAQNILTNRLDTAFASKLDSLTDEDKLLIAQSIGYTSSYTMAKTLGVEANDFNMQSLLVGYVQGLRNEKPQLEQKLMAEALDKFFKPREAISRKNKQRELDNVAKLNIKKGVDYLVENAKKSTVTETPSGLQYEVIKKGNGNKPTENDRIKVHYHGTLIDGTVFDSSVERKEPITFAVNEVIKGWQEGVQLMPVGAKYRLVIPASLAYGNQPIGNIPPGSTLIFEVELLEIEK